MSVVWVYKPIGWTLKQTIDHYKTLVNCTNSKISFAGRLDPMASGVLALILDDSKSLISSSLTSHYKTYRFNVILGLTTDTFDILGLITKIYPPHFISRDKISSILSDISHIKSQQYPPFSSRSVSHPLTGKKISLWEITKMGIHVDPPNHDIDIKYLSLLSDTTITYYDLFNIISSRINTLSPSSDFRQSDILKLWESYLPIFNNRLFQIITCEASVSPGTYIRGIANSINGVAYDITRISYNDLISIPYYDPFTFTLL